MASMLDKKNRYNENDKNKYGFLIVAIFLIWLFWPNNNSFIRLSYWADNVVYSMLKFTHTNKVPEYIHYRNGAIYLAKIYPNKSEPAINAINKAIATVPADIAEKELSKLYKEGAAIKLYYGDKAGALNDYLSAKFLEDKDKFVIAILLADESRYAEAAAKCNEILLKNNFVMLGYVCLAYAYEKAGDIQSASRIYESLIEQKPNSEMVYMERANFRKRIDDIQGAQEDIKKAKKYSSYSVDNYTSIIDKSVNLKELQLSLI